MPGSNGIFGCARLSDERKIYRARSTLAAGLSFGLQQREDRCEETQPIRQTSELGENLQILCKLRFMKVSAGDTIGHIALNRYILELGKIRSWNGTLNTTYRAKI
ncbi:MAG: hypothetical protein U5J63_16075 [Fodinibius sp.]|nr:hypothetical protein [Fodinibius sp.]